MRKHTTPLTNRLQTLLVVYLVKLRLTSLKFTRVKLFFLYGSNNSLSHINMPSLSEGRIFFTFAEEGNLVVVRGNLCWLRLPRKGHVVKVSHLRKMSSAD